MVHDFFFLRAVLFSGTPGNVSFRQALDCILISLFRFKISQVKKFLSNIVKSFVFVHLDRYQSVFYNEFDRIIDGLIFIDIIFSRDKLSRMHQVLDTAINTNVLLYIFTQAVNTLTTPIDLFAFFAIPFNKCLEACHAFKNAFLLFISFLSFFAVGFKQFNVITAAEILNAFNDFNDFFKSLCFNSVFYPFDCFTNVF